MTVWDFASEHWFVTLLLALIVASAIKAPFKYGFLAWNRYLRSKNIRERGWPKPPFDADGDVVMPDRED